MVPPWYGMSFGLESSVLFRRFHLEDARAPMVGRPSEVGSADEEGERPKFVDSTRAARAFSSWTSDRMRLTSDLRRPFSKSSEFRSRILLEHFKSSLLLPLSKDESSPCFATGCMAAFGAFLGFISFAKV